MDCWTHPVPLTGSETQQRGRAGQLHVDTPRAPHGVGNAVLRETEKAMYWTHPVPLTGSETLEFAL